MEQTLSFGFIGSSGDNDLDETLSVGPITRLSFGVRDCDDYQAILLLAIDYLVGISTHEEITMQLVTKRESARFGLDRLQTARELLVKSFGCLDAPLGVPAEGFREIFFRSGRNEQLTHQARLSVERGCGLRARTMSACDPRHIPTNDVGPH